MCLAADADGQTSTDMSEPGGNDMERILKRGRDPALVAERTAGGAVAAQIGSTRFSPDVRVLGTGGAAAVLCHYEHRNRFLAPVVRRVLSRLAGFDCDQSAPSGSASSRPLRS